MPRKSAASSAPADDQGAERTETEGGAPLVSEPSLQESLASLQRQIEAQREQIEALRSAGHRPADVAGSKVMQTTTARKRRADVEKWLETPLPETMLFAVSPGCQLQALEPKEEYDPQTRGKKEIPGVHIEFRVWQGVGSDLLHPENPRKRRIEWGVCDLATMKEVRDEVRPSAVVKASIESSPSYRQKRVFWGPEAQRRLRAVYNIQWAYDDAREEDRRIAEELPPGAAKMGMALATG